MASLYMVAADASNMFPDTVEHFELADENGDGLIDRSEFVSFVELEAEDDIGASRRIISRNIHDRAFSNMDANEDDFLSRAEIGDAQSRLQ